MSAEESGAVCFSESRGIEEVGGGGRGGIGIWIEELGGRVESEDLVVRWV